MARYYRSDLGTNAAVSAEITGYAVSALVYLFEARGQADYLEAALRAARYLTREAWSEASSTFPFEPGSDRAYFFDTGIIVRGLLAAWRASGEREFRDRAREAALSLAFDFLGDGQFHPVIALPSKQPLPGEPRWSRTPGCYQLKAALAWHGIAEEFHDPEAARLFEGALASALSTHESFLPGDSDPGRVMDRLHAYCYFLEGLLWAAGREPVRRVLAPGVARAAGRLREIAPGFERSDVHAQLLRVRLIAHHLGLLPLDQRAAGEEAARLAAFCIGASADPRLDGGVWFGSRDGAMLPYVNPASAIFAAQALALWRQHCSGSWNFELSQLV